MLVDDVRSCLRSGYLSMMPDAATLLSRIAEARAWILDDDVTRAAANLSFMRPSNMLRNMVFARSPAPVAWIEYPAPVRDAFVAESFGLGVREGATPVEKIGLLIRRTNGDETGDMPSYACDVFWRYRHQDSQDPTRIGMATHELSWSLDGPTPEAIADLRRLGEQQISEANAAVKRHLRLNDPEEAEAQVRLSAYFTCSMRASIRETIAGAATFEIMRSRTIEEAEAISRKATAALDEIGDALHEAPFLVAALLLMNSTNAVQTRDADLAKLNRARKKGGKDPLQDHAVVSMRLTKVQGNRMRAQGVTGETRRYHWAKGHFKPVERRVFDDRGRPTGEKVRRLVWWTDQWRGDLSKGIAPAKTRLVKP